MAKQTSKPPSLTDAVIALAQDSTPGPSTWFTRLPAEVQQELDALKKRWLAGEIPVQKRPLARAVIDTVRARGHATAGLQGVEDWLHGGRHR
jgi:hypothetical protein